MFAFPVDVLSVSTNVDSYVHSCSIDQNVYVHVQKCGIRPKPPATKMDSAGDFCSVPPFLDKPLRVMEISERPQIGKEHTNNPTNSPNSTSPYSHTSHYQSSSKTGVSQNLRPQTGLDVENWGWPGQWSKKPDWLLVPNPSPGNGVIDRGGVKMAY